MRLKGQGTSFVVSPPHTDSLEMPQSARLPAERVAKYGKKVEQRGWVAVFAILGLSAFVTLQISVFFFDVGSPLHFSFIPDLLASLAPEQRRRLVSSLAEWDLLPEDLASEDPYLAQAEFLPNRRLCFPVAVLAADASQAASLVKMGFGAVEVSDHRFPFQLARQDLTKHALVGVRTQNCDNQEISDLLELFDWVTLDLAAYDTEAEIVDILAETGNLSGKVFVRLSVRASEKIGNCLGAHNVTGVMLTNDECGQVESWGAWLAKAKLPTFRVIAPLQPQSQKTTRSMAAGAHLVMAEEISDLRVARRVKNELTHNLILGGYYDVNALIGSKWRDKTPREQEAHKNKRSF